MHLRHVLVSPDIIKNLISVRQFTTDNNVSVEFDPLGLSVKDLDTRNLIVRCNSTGRLYPLHLPTHHPPHALLAGATPTTLWHQRLGHLGFEALSKLIPACNKNELESLCHACQLGRHTRLPFVPSHSRAVKNFDLIHCDLWTSPILSVSGFKYYLIILDDCSHFTWTFPLRLKSDTFQALSDFFAHVRTQFGCTIKSIQCDNGREFDNSSSHTFFLSHGATMRMSCPHTSPQNGRAERIIRTTNDIMRTLMFQASLPTTYWVEALRAATYLLNLRPTKTLSFATPYFALFRIHPDLSHLRVFGCKCYPNLSATAPHKLAPRSTVCVFLGYPLEHKGYKCLDLTTNRIIISRHVTFDESSFPFAEISNPPSSHFDFLSDLDCTSLPVGTMYSIGPIALVPSGAAAPVPSRQEVARRTTAQERLDTSAAGRMVYLDTAPAGHMPQAAASVPGATTNEEHPNAAPTDSRMVCLDTAPAGHVPQVVASVLDATEDGVSLVDAAGGAAPVLLQDGVRARQEADTQECPDVVTAGNVTATVGVLSSPLTAPMDTTQTTLPARAIPIVQVDNANSWQNWLSAPSQ